MANRESRVAIYRHHASRAGRAPEDAEDAESAESAEDQVGIWRIIWAWHEAPRGPQLTPHNPRLSTREGDASVWATDRQRIGVLSHGDNRWRLRSRKSPSIVAAARERGGSRVGKRGWSDGEAVRGWGGVRKAAVAHLLSRKRHRDAARTEPAGRRGFIRDGSWRRGLDGAGNLNGAARVGRCWGGTGRGRAGHRGKACRSRRARRGTQQRSGTPVGVPLLHAVRSALMRCSADHCCAGDGGDDIAAAPGLLRISLRR